MNEEKISINKLYILEIICSIGPGFSHNIIRDCKDNMTDIVWIASYMRYNFDLEL